MAHLIKLELKKFGTARNIIFTFAAILFSILFITVSLWDSMTDPEQTKDTFESTYLVIGLLMSFIFLVYSSVLTARLVWNPFLHPPLTTGTTACSTFRKSRPARERRIRMCTLMS